jgi:uncharacterized protein (DUF3084 family)
MTEYMGKKVNMFLIIMIIVVLIGMGGLSIYFQQTFKSVNTAYNEVSADLEKTSNELAITKNELNAVRSNLNNTESDIRKYDDLYAQKQGELDARSKELADTKASLQRETLFKQQFQKQAEELAEDKEDLEDQVDRLSNLVADLRQDLEDCEDELG